MTRKRQRTGGGEASPPPAAAAAGQEQRVREALERGDRQALERLAFAEFGFASLELRREAWLQLLGLSRGDVADTSWRGLLDGLDGDSDSSTARVIAADVQRSVYSWDVHTNINDKTRDRKRVQLSEVMHAILRKHVDRLAYFQGFHDIVLVFMEVGSPSHAFHMVERLALFQLSDQLCYPLDQGLLPLLGVLYQLVAMLDPPLATALLQAGCAEMHFAVPWVLTWFAHSLPRLHTQVMRLFDCLLAAHPSAILYFCAALLLQQRQALLDAPREMPEVVAIIQGFSWASLDVDAWALHAQALMEEVPPVWLLWRLRTFTQRRLPATTPLLHYPHPWMDNQLPLFTSHRDMSQMAPVYLPASRARRVGLFRVLREVPKMVWHTGSRMAMRLLRLGLRGGVAVAALALLSRAAGLAERLPWAAQAAKTSHKS